MAKKVELEKTDPVSHIPHDAAWYPAETSPGHWQGHRKWIEPNEGSHIPCHCAENDVEDGKALIFPTRDKCQTRCDTLNARLEA